MKTILKYALALLLGGIAGYAISLVVKVVATNATWATVWAGLPAGLLDLCTSLLILFAAFALAVIAQIVLHECGHLLGGLLTGYRFVSLRLFSLTLVRNSDRLALKRFSIAGTAGQCLMEPPRKPIDQTGVVAYNIGGVAVNALTGVAALGTLWLVDAPSSFVLFFLICFGGLGIALAVLNGFPMRVGGVGNDGYNVQLLLHNAASKQAFIQQLRVNSLIQQGMRPNELPGDVFISEFDPIDYSDPMQVAGVLNLAARHIDLMQIPEALQELDKAYAHRRSILPIYVCEIACELTFCLLVIGDEERARRIYTRQVRKYARRHLGVMSSRQRLLFAIQLYRDGDRAAATATLNALRDHSAAYLMQGEVRSDLWVMQQLLDQYRQ